MKPRYSIIISLNRTFVFLVVALVVLGKVFGAGGLWYASAAAETACLVLSALFIHRVLRSTKEEQPLLSSARP